MADGERRFRIAHLSDLHCGGPYFEANLLERAISEVNEFEPDVVICSGDLTTFGFKHEYQVARSYLERIDCDSFVVVPGNHDARNVGYVHFENLFGDRNSVLRKDGITVVAVDSTNHAVRNMSGPASNKRTRIAKVAISKADDNAPMTRVNRRIAPMSHICGRARSSSSTASNGMPTSDKS